MHNTKEDAEMILSTHTDDTNRKGVKSATILLHDTHLEYGSTLIGREGRWDDGSNYNGDLIWDHYDLEEVAHGVITDDGQDPATLAFNLIFGRHREGLGLHGDDLPLHVLKLEGTIQGLRGAFDRLADALDTVPTGDDDSFDYWPNTMETLARFANDLATLGDKAPTERALMIYTSTRKGWDAAQGDHLDFAADVLSPDTLNTWLGLEG